MKNEPTQEEKDMFIAEFIEHTILGNLKDIMPDIEDEDEVKSVTN